jgi:hypothetical protein
LVPAALASPVLLQISSNRVSPTCSIFQPSVEEGTFRFVFSSQAIAACYLISFTSRHFPSCANHVPPLRRQSSRCS